jgi:GAF domain
MSTGNSLDRESFEKFLANALAVQESGLDQKSLYAVVEIQHFIATQDLDLDQAMQRIAECLLRLFRASGVATALLDGSGLVYRAGAGSAAENVGHHFVAVLNVSSSNDVRREILRVEDAENDRRIEAEICRQFGAQSLLILPICADHSLLGILQVLYDDAHAFNEREIRVCRMMIGALEEGMARRQQLAKKQETMASVEETTAEQHRSDREGRSDEAKVTAAHVSAPAVETIALHGQALTNPDDQLAPALLHHSEGYDAVLVGEVNSLWTKLTAATGWLLDRSSRANYGRVRIALAAALVLGLAAWLMTISHPSTSAKAPSVTMQPDTETAAPANSLLVKDEPNPSSDGARETKPDSEFRRVVVGPNEVDYVADDVTIRRFTVSSPKPRVRSGMKEVNLGDDVTVRYFVNDAAVRSRLPSSSVAGPTTEHPPSAQR